MRSSNPSNEREWLGFCVNVVDTTFPDLAQLCEIRQYLILAGRGLMLKVQAPISPLPPISSSITMENLSNYEAVIALLVLAPRCRAFRRNPSRSTV